MKKITALILTLIIGTCGVFAAPADTVDEFFDTSMFNDTQIVLRSDCVTAIDRVVGMIDNFMRTCDQTPALSSDLEDEDEYQKWLDTYFSFKFEPVDIHALLYYTNIICGEYKNEDGTVYFNYMRPATVKETLAFAARCFKNENALDLSDLDIAVKYAETLGLIKPEDEFYNNTDKEISPDELFIILERLANMPVYLYFDRCYLNEGFYELEDSKYTYLEVIKAVKNDEFCLIHNRPIWER